MKAVPAMSAAADRTVFVLDMGFLLTVSSCAGRVLIRVLAGYVSSRQRPVNGRAGPLILLRLVVALRGIEPPILVWRGAQHERRQSSRTTSKPGNRCGVVRAQSNNCDDVAYRIAKHGLRISQSD